MTQTKQPHTPIRLSAKRIFTAITLFAGIAAGYWFLLPAIQALIIPDAPGGEGDSWIVRPILAFRFGAMAVMTAVSLPIFMAPLHQAWAEEDAQSRTDQTPKSYSRLKRAGLFIKGGLLFIVYAAGFVFYLFSWTTLNPDGIAERVVWKTMNHSYDDIESLEKISEGKRSESKIQNGPWYSVRLKSGRSVILSLDNEGTDAKELERIAEFVAARSGLTWNERSDSRSR